MQQQIFHRSCYQQTCQTADRRCGTDGKLTIIPDTEDVEEAEAEAALEKELEAEDKTAEE